jgi:anaerobic magnesium-protoporphyrin IX monomethyl ester cyclase
MDALLINPPIREWAKPNCVPLGLGYIASTLRNAGHTVEVLDINGYRYPKDQVVHILEGKDPDIIFTGGIITVYNYLKWLTATVREIYGDIPVIIGGSVSTSIPEIALSTLSTDIACIGEGEVTTVEVADALESGRDLVGIQGIYYKQDGRILKNAARPPVRDMDQIPFPAYDLLPMEIYVNNPVGYINKDKWGRGERLGDDVPRSTNINVTRGCPYRCAFCYHDYLGPGYRHRSPRNILAEMDLLHERYGVEYFLWSDDESIIDRKFIRDFCDLMVHEGRDYQFSVSGRVNLVDEPLLTRLKEAGCSMVGYGIESGSQKILDAMNKGVTVEQAKRAVRLTQKIFGDADCSFMIGYPGETDETIRETEEFCRELELAPEVIFFATAYPGTRLYEYAKERGLITDEVAYISSLWEQGEKIAINFTDWPDDLLFEKRQRLVESLKAWNLKRHSVEETV